MDRTGSEQLQIAPGRMIRHRRELLGWRAAELSRRAGINPRTYDAIEKGRIVSPSIKNLQAIARALGVSVAALFAESVTTSSQSNGVFSEGNQKGRHTLEFPKEGFRIVCYTPFVPNIFIGKVILKGEGRIDRKMIPTAGLVFVQGIMGKLSVQFEGKDHLVREGHYAFFDGAFPYTCYNPQYKECTFLLVTVPSFLAQSATR